jgi:molybdate transport system substrate-binding protein
MLYDFVIVGAPEIDAFVQAGKVQSNSRVDLVRSGVGVAVRAGAPKPDISSSVAIKNAFPAAKSVAYSSGPSGVYMQKLFEKLGIAEQMKAKVKQAVSGTRVGGYLARGDAELGFQQIAELIHEKGIDFLGPLPPDIQNITVFSSGILTVSKNAEAAKAFQTFLAAPAAAPVIKKNGMEPATPN